MAKIKVSDLKPGAVCSDNVTGRGAMVLVKSGMTVTEEIIGYLKQWGVEEIEIFGGKISEQEALDGELVGKDAASIDSEEFERVAQRFFKHTDIEHPAMAALYGEYITRMVTARLMAGQPEDAAG